MNDSLHEPRIAKHPTRCVETISSWRRKASNKKKIFSKLNDFSPLFNSAIAAHTYSRVPAHGEMKIGKNFKINIYRRDEKWFFMSSSSVFFLFIHELLAFPSLRCWSRLKSGGGIACTAHSARDHVVWFIWISAPVHVMIHERPRNK